VPAPGQADVYVVLAGAAAEAVGLELSESLRDAAPALRIETNCGGGSFKSQLKRADRSGANLRSSWVGTRRRARRVAALKALRGDAGQREVTFEELGAELPRTAGIRVEQ
jgi:histidyl-tRNA synthetase